MPNPEQENEQNSQLNESLPTEGTLPQRSLMVNIQREIALSTYPSASIVEVLRDSLAVMGDDASSLLLLNRDLSVIGTVELFAHPAASNGQRIPKAEKPDLEAGLVIQDGAIEKLVLLGSGSLPQLRERGFVVQPADGATPDVREISLQGLYARIKAAISDPAVQPSAEQPNAVQLNIEAAVTTPSHVILFQRGGLTGDNYGIYFDKSAFMKWLNDGDVSGLQPQAVRYELPSLQGVPAGFSGASYVAALDRIVFTASVEDSADPILDGAVLGSFVGTLSCACPGTIESCAVLEGAATTPKIESISIVDCQPDGAMQAIAVADDDCGGSTLFELRLRI